MLEAALRPLSAPKPVDKERDLHAATGAAWRRPAHPSPRRAVAAGDGAGGTSKTTLLLTMGYDDLRAGLRGATTVGARRRHPPRPRDRAAAVPRRSVIPLVLSGPRRCSTGARATVLHPRPDQTAVAARQQVHLPGLRRPRHSGPTDTTCSTGQITAPPTWATLPALRAAPHGRAHPPLRRPRPARPAGGTGGVGPGGPRLLRRAPRPTVRATPGVNRRDPTPHPTGAGGVIGHVRRFASALAVGRLPRLPTACLPSVRLPSVCLPSACLPSGCSRRPLTRVPISDAVPVAGGAPA